MGVAIAIILTVVLIALVLIARQNNANVAERPQVADRRDPTKTGSQFHAVSIRYADSACDAAKATEGTRFLSALAPRIPLPECDVAQCRCRFIHHADRRSGIDRRGQHTKNMLGSTGEYTGKERRYRGDRRGSDEPQNFFA